MLKKWKNKTKRNQSCNRISFFEFVFVVCMKFLTTFLISKRNCFFKFSTIAWMNKYRSKQSNFNSNLKNDSIIFIKQNFFIYLLLVSFYDSNFRNDYTFNSKQCQLFLKFIRQKNLFHFAIRIFAIITRSVQNNVNWF